MRLGRAVVLILFALLACVYTASAWVGLSNGAQPQVSYTEPTTNTDGSPLTDLGQICHYWRVDAGATTQTCVASSSPTGGGAVINATPFIAPILPNQAGTVFDGVSAKNTQGLEGPRSADASVFIDRVAQGGPAVAVAAWAFDENQGTVANSTTANSNGIITGATWVPGNFGPALSFNGTTTIVDVGTTNVLADLRRFTVTAWVKPTSYGAGILRIVDKRVNGGWSVKHGPSAIALQQDFSTTGGEWTAAPLALNTWTHIAIIYDNTSTANVPQVYINGVLRVVSTVSSPAGSYVSDVSSKFTIGARTTGQFFQGVIDNVRVYSSVLSQAEIQTDMTQPIGGGSVPSPASDVGVTFAP